MTREGYNIPLGCDQGVSAQVTVAILTKFEYKVRVHQVWTTVLCALRHMRPVCMPMQPSLHLCHRRD